MKKFKSSKPKKPADLTKVPSTTASLELGSNGTVYSLHRTSSVCDLKEAQKRHPLFEKGIRYQRNGSSSTMPSMGFLNSGTVANDVGIPCVKDANWCTNDCDENEGITIEMNYLSVAREIKDRSRAPSFVFDRRPSMQVIRE